MTLRHAAVITARCGSSRLARKHLREANRRPILTYSIRRIAAEFADEVAAGTVRIVIATGEEPENRAFEAVAPEGVEVFYGAPRNLPLRHRQLCDALGIDAVIAVDGDDILCSRTSMRAVFDALERGASYTGTSGLPLGMNAWGYTAGFVRRCMAGHDDEVLETGWHHVFDQSVLQKLELNDIANDDRLRLTLDYEEDLAFFDALITSFGEGIIDATDRELVDRVYERSLWQINAGRAAEFWKAFYAGRDAEIRHLQKDHGGAP